MLQWLSLLTFTLFFFLTIGYSAVDSLFMAYAGGKMIPVAWIVLGALAIPITPWFANVTARTRPVRLFSGILLAGVAMMIGMWLLAYGESASKYVLFYALKELYALFLLGFFWIYVAGFLDTQQAKRFLPILAAVWSLGDFVGGRITGLFAHALGTKQLFLVWAAGTLLLIPVLWQFERRFSRVAPATGKPLRLNLGPLIGRIRSTRLLTGLALMSAMFLAVGITLRFQYYEIFGHAFPDVDAGAAFLGNLRAYVSVFKVGLGLFLLPRLVQWIGVRNVLLLYPVGALVAVAVLAAAPGLTAASLGFFVVIGMGQAIYEPTLSLTFNILSPGERNTLRAFFNGIMNPTGALLASGALLAAVVTGAPDFVTVLVNLSIATAMLFAVWLVRKAYVHTVLHGLRQSGRFQFETAGQGRLPREWISELEKRWESSNSEEKKRILEFFQGQPELAPDFLERALTDENPSVRASFCTIAQGRWALRPEQIILLLGDSSPRVRVAAAQYAGAAAFDDVEPLAALLHDESPAVRAEAAVSLWRIGDLEQVEVAVARISAAMKGAAEEQIPALTALGRLEDPKYLRTVVRFAQHEDKLVRLAAARTARSLAHPSGTRWIGALAAWLRASRGEERNALIEALGRIGGSEAAHALLAEAAERGSPAFFRLRDALRKMGKPAVSPSLSVLTNRRESLSVRILALSVLNHIHPPERKLLLMLAREGLSETLALTARAQVLSGETNYGAKVLALLYREQADLARTFAVRALFAWHRYHGVRWVEQGLRSQDRAVRANAAEALLNLAPAAMRGELALMLDPDAVLSRPPLSVCLREAAAKPGSLWSEAAAIALVNTMPKQVA